MFPFYLGLSWVFCVLPSKWYDGTWILNPNSFLLINHPTADRCSLNFRQHRSINHKNLLLDMQCVICNVGNYTDICKKASSLTSPLRGESGKTDVGKLPMNRWMNYQEKEIMEGRPRLPESLEIGKHEWDMRNVSKMFWRDEVLINGNLMILYLDSVYWSNSDVISGRSHYVQSTKWSRWNVFHCTCDSHSVGEMGYWWNGGTRQRELENWCTVSLEGCRTD
jgi:hypothetical protein